MALAGDPPAGEMTDPVEILKKVDAVCKAVKTVRYDIVFEGLGDSKSSMPETRGKFAVVPGGGDATKGRLRADVKVKQPGSDEAQEVTVASDGENYTVLDHKNKKAYQDIDPAVLGSFRRIVMGAALSEYGHQQPFSDEINGKKQELKGTQKIGDDECYEIHVVYGEGQEATWCFSKKRFIPLRRIDIRQRDGKTMTMQKTLTNVVLDEKVDESMFKLAVPAGYEKIDDFAP